MLKRREALTLAIGLTAALSVAVAAQNPAPTPPKKDDKKQAEALRKEGQEIFKLVDMAAAGQPTPNDFGIAWVHDDVLKAQGNKEYVPFSVSLDGSKIASPTLALYYRVVQQGAGAPPPAPPSGKNEKNDKKDDKKDDKKAQQQKYPYEDFVQLPVQQGQNPLRISRSFTVSAGAYDVFIVVKEPASDQKNAPSAKVSVLKHTVTIPDFWTSELTTSSVIVAQRIEPLNQALSPQEQAERPYALGSMEITPAFDAKFSKKNELSTFLLIYNPKTDPMNKPDVTVEYNFYQKPSGQPEKFFNKTNPQALNAQTLPPQFDMTQGHQLQTGQAVPLASFPEGDYRLEIKITDKLANKTVTRDVNFTVTS